MSHQLCSGKRFFPGRSHGSVPPGLNRVCFSQPPFEIPPLRRFFRRVPTQICISAPLSSRSGASRVTASGPSAQAGPLFGRHHRELLLKLGRQPSWCCPVDCLADQVGDVDASSQIRLSWPGDTRRGFERGAERFACIARLSSPKFGPLGALLHRAATAQL